MRAFSRVITILAGSAKVVLPPPLCEQTALRGVEAIDHVAYSLAIGDSEPIERLIAFERVGCVTASDQLSARPFCEPPESFGAPVQALAVEGCGRRYLRRGD